MDNVKYFSADLLRQARGNRSRNEIASRSDGNFTEQDLYNWEKGKNDPPLKKFPFLLAALDAEYDDLVEARTAS